MVTSYYQIVKQLVRSGKYTMKEVSERYTIPYRTVQNWVYGVSKPPEYVERMIALIEAYNGQCSDSINHDDKELIRLKVLNNSLKNANVKLRKKASETMQLRSEIYSLRSHLTDLEVGIEKAQDLLHDERFAEAIEIIDNL